MAGVAGAGAMPRVGLDGRAGVKQGRATVFRFQQ